ncbi:uncharacterized protein LOC144338195 isoform X2 [Macaca mulatta]
MDTCHRRMPAAAWGQTPTHKTHRDLWQPWREAAAVGRGAGEGRLGQVDPGSGSAEPGWPTGASTLKGPRGASEAKLRTPWKGSQPPTEPQEGVGARPAPPPCQPWLPTVPPATVTGPPPPLRSAKGQESSCLHPRPPQRPPCRLCLPRAQCQLCRHIGPVTGLWRDGSHHPAQEGASACVSRTNPHRPREEGSLPLPLRQGNGHTTETVSAPTFRETETQTGHVASLRPQSQKRSCLGAPVLEPRRRHQGHARPGAPASSPGPAPVLEPRRRHQGQHKQPGPSWEPAP